MVGEGVQDAARVVGRRVDDVEQGERAERVGEVALPDLPSAPLGHQQVVHVRGVGLVQTV